MVKSLDEVIERLQYKADNIKAKLEPSYFTECVDYLKECKTAEEQGLLLRLPCKVGDTVWFVGNEFVNDYEIRRYIADESGIDCIRVAKDIDGKEYWNSFNIDDFGKTVFLTKEEAEQKLAEMKGE